MTEICGVTAILPPKSSSMALLGLRFPYAEIKFPDVPEAGYFVANDLPQGEILVQGASVARLLRAR